MTTAGRLGLTPGDRPRASGVAPVTIEGRGERLLIRTSSPRAALALWRTRGLRRPAGRVLAFAGLRAALKLGPLPALTLRLG